MEPVKHVILDPIPVPGSILQGHKEQSNGNDCNQAIKSCCTGFCPDKGHDGKEGDWDQ